MRQRNPLKDTGSSNEPRSLSSSEDDHSAESDIPEDLHAILSSQSEDGASMPSFEDTLSMPCQPESPLSATFSIPVTTTTDIPTTIVTPSIVLYDSNNEGVGTE